VIIVWFRRDLRLDDHPALLAAIDAGQPVLPLFIWSPEEDGGWPPGAASRWWLHQSLKALDASLCRIGSRLILRRGSPAKVLADLTRETGAASVHFTRAYEPAARQRDADIESALRDAGIAVRQFGSALLFEPWEVLKARGQPFRVFTPFWKACMAQDAPATPRPAPKRLNTVPESIASVPLESLELEPAIDWVGGMRSFWHPGEQGARKRLSTFIGSALSSYETGRDRPGVDGTSRLSPHLHFGEVSPSRVWHEASAGAARTGSPGGAQAFLREIGWREFGYHLLYHFPHTTDRALDPRFDAFPWQYSEELLKAWQKGITGYPLVDAGMRQLWRTGWMHNRVRMIVASFLVKHLLLPWQDGARWFWDTLVDADLANNTLGWQWVAGSGADAAPYFRIFNPVLQGEKFDPDGSYVRQWVPELAHVPVKWVHRPWDAPDVPSAYPRPVVDHASARQRALAAFASLSSPAAKPRVRMRS
jgi:deoxyribodipyrimidine photo-lyase